MAKGKKTGGRGKGVSNKATQQAREAIASFVDGNAHRLQGWLDRIAEGVEKAKPPGADPNEPVEYLVKPDPQTAFELFQSVIEYHVPKLARTMLEGEIGIKGSLTIRD